MAEEASSSTIPAETGDDFDLSENESTAGNKELAGPLAPDSDDSEVDDRENEEQKTNSISALTEDTKEVEIKSEDEVEEFHEAVEEISPVRDTRLDLQGQGKHFFVLSEAGKPIYTLHGDEEVLISQFAVMQALVSYVADSGDSIRSLRCSDCIIVFVNKAPLILVGVSNQLLSAHQLVVQLNYMYNQMLSVLTLTDIKRRFEHRRNYDLRHRLSGSERLMNHLASAMDTDPSFFLAAVRCLPLAPHIRDVFSETIVRLCPKKDIVFGILVADNQLVTLVRMKKYYIHPSDLHLLLNMINATESFKNSESWTPLCLPKFDSSGFLHAHVSYLSDEVPLCLVLISVDRNSFFQLSEARNKIIERLEKNNVIASVKDALERSNYSTGSVEVPEMRHFLYKSKRSAQFIMPSAHPVYRTAKESAHLYTCYRMMQNRFHSISKPIKLLHWTTSREVLLGWMTLNFELYCVFPPTVTKLAAIAAVNKLLRWIKHEEERLFILSAPTF